MSAEMPPVALGLLACPIFVAAGLLTGFILNLLVPITDTYDNYRRVVFSFVVAGVSALARITESYIIYGKTFREGWWIYVWILALVFGISLFGHIVRMRYPQAEEDDGAD